MKLFINPPQIEWKVLTERPNTGDKDEIMDSVRRIVTTVEEQGDIALFDFARRFDNVQLEDLEVSLDEINSSEYLVDEDLQQSILKAAENIRAFHAAQLIKTIEVETIPGVKCYQKAVPIKKVGLYIPGGTAPLFSTVLMLAIPAQIAGCKDIILCTPPDQQGQIHPAILFAARICGVHKIYKVGGAQAIAAMAYGTETIPKVNKIFGPGNSFVTLAKQVVSTNQVAIDMPAGPSEVLIMADETANAAFIAADLLSQAEHGNDSQTILVTNSRKLAGEVLTELNKQVEMLPRCCYAKNSLSFSKAFVFDATAEMIAFSNDYAPEHLIIAMQNTHEIAEQIDSAGSVFLGNWTPESAGDYASGTNHTLPTSGWAQAFSGVNLDSFIKKITFQEITPAGLAQLGPTIEIMAKAEGLDAHSNAVTIRLKELQNSNTEFK
ncbi:MAG: histidinol dehydrogenase [Bacteroidales bacterium]